MHEHDGDEGDGEVALAGPHLVLAAGDDLAAAADRDENPGVHVDQADHGEDAGGQGRVPQHGQGVPGVEWRRVRLD